MGSRETFMCRLMLLLRKNCQEGEAHRTPRRVCPRKELQRQVTQHTHKAIVVVWLPRDDLKPWIASLFSRKTRISRESQLGTEVSLREQIVMRGSSSLAVENASTHFLVTCLVFSSGIQIMTNAWTNVCCLSNQKAKQRMSSPQGIISNWGTRIYFVVVQHTAVCLCLAKHSL